ncbi:MAG: hypothetical protein AAGA53_15775 [Pseudomonadota bacterium]
MPGHLDRITQAHKVEEKEPKFSAKAAKLIVLLTAGLLAFSILLYGFVSLFGGGISRGGHSASTQQLEVIVGNSALRIPANTIRFQSQRHAGAHGRIELYLHWPTLSGYNDVLEASFSRASDQSDLIFLSLEPRTMSLDMSGRIEPIYSRFFDGPAKKASAGLIRQPLSPDGGFIDEDLYYEASSPYPFVTRCARPKSTISTPFCIRDIHVGKDLMLTYRFHVRHLPDWIKIDRRIRQYAKALLITR